ncbi:MAG: hypothetical protein Q8K93_02190 [Reyranella sp.]|uniref:hypothetical protein n=1 Tax=Reyranella sp. TaxID=1929291 RepID=UPI002731DB16|nr:hypothetical protein [Reyranella sp.]MDP1960990.1 hypothetical protein [Reyranella sp.]MDP2374186.1 hypothetical protein [Reyranella sp.]
MQRFLLGCVIALGMSLTLGLTPDAGAQSMRHPKTGEPAMVLDLPAGWTPQYNVRDNVRGHLEYYSADLTRCINLAMMVDERFASKSLAEIAAATLKEDGLPPYTHTQDGSIAGRAGEAFLSTVNYGDQRSVNITRPGSAPRQSRVSLA